MAVGDAALQPIGLIRKGVRSHLSPGGHALVRPPSVIELSLSFDFEETHQSVVSAALSGTKNFPIRDNRNNLISLIRLLHINLLVRVLERWRSILLRRATNLAASSYSLAAAIGVDDYYYFFFTNSEKRAARMLGSRWFFFLLVFLFAQFLMNC